MRSKASIEGHPIHPMIVPFPIAFFLAALLFDVIHVWSGAGRKSDVWYKLSYWNLVLALIGGAAAAVPGALDYFTSLNVPARRPALLHAVLNIVAMMVGALNLVLRLRGRASIGPSRTYTILLSTLDAVLLTVSGWLGGEIVYRHGVAVEVAPPHRRRLGGKESEGKAVREAA